MLFVVTEPEKAISPEKSWQWDTTWHVRRQEMNELPETLKRLQTFTYLLS
jgi:hypothetical protein